MEPIAADDAMRLPILLAQTAKEQFPVSATKSASA